MSTTDTIALVLSVLAIAISLCMLASTIRKHRRRQRRHNAERESARLAELNTGGMASTFAGQPIGGVAGLPIGLPIGGTIGMASPHIGGYPLGGTAGLPPIGGVAGASKKGSSSGSSLADLKRLHQVGGLSPDDIDHRLGEMSLSRDSDGKVGEGSPRVPGGLAGRVHLAADFTRTDDTTVESFYDDETTPHPVTQPGEINALLSKPTPDTGWAEELTVSRAERTDDPWTTTRPDDTPEPNQEK